MVSKSLLFIASLVISIFFAGMLWKYFEPRWETNDDVGMSMVAHGYGNVAAGSPKLIFSNVVWGGIVRIIPEFSGVLGYSSASFGVLVLAGTALLNGLFRSGANCIVCLSVFGLILIRPILFPQFTINAGLLMMGAVLCWIQYARLNERRFLVAGCLLAYLSYLIRSHEFFLILVIAAPLLPCRTILSRKSAKTAFFALMSAIVSSAFIDHQAYRGEAWQTFNEINPVRVPYTDYGAAEHLMKRSDILKKYGYSANDMEMIRNFYVADPRIMDPEKLRAMIKELGPLTTKEGALKNGWLGIRALWHPCLFPFLISSLLLAMLLPNRNIAISWGLCITAIFVLGLMGRPGVMRIYVPILSLLVVAPLFVAKTTHWRKFLCASVLLVACLFNASRVISESKMSSVTIECTRKALSDFPKKTIVIWGGAFPFEYAYPVMGIPSNARQYKLYSLACFTAAPFSIAYCESQEGNGMIDRLLSEHGVPIVAYEYQFKLLEVYCQEHLHGKYEVLSTRQYGDIILKTCRCR